MCTYFERLESGDVPVRYLSSFTVVKHHYNTIAIVHFGISGNVWIQEFFCTPTGMHVLVFEDFNSPGTSMPLARNL